MRCMLLRRCRAGEGLLPARTRAEREMIERSGAGGHWRQIKRKFGDGGELFFVSFRFAFVGQCRHKISETSSKQFFFVFECSCKVLFSVVVLRPLGSRHNIYFVCFFCGFLREEEAMGRGRGGCLRLPTREKQQSFAMGGCYC